MSNQHNDDLQSKLDDFRRDVYERYGERIAQKREKAFYSSGSDVLKERSNDENKDALGEATKAVPEQKTDSETDRINHGRNSNNMKCNKMKSNVSLILGILSLIGLILFFFL